MPIFNFEHSALGGNNRFDMSGNGAVRQLALR
jgi:hypothetical protein